MKATDKLRGAIMSDKHMNLIHKAKLKYGQIFPCSNKSSWADCFSAYEGKLYFWFNAEDCSTHVEIDE